MRRRISTFSFVEFILNYLVAPIVGVLLWFGKLLKKLVSDVWTHIYGKFIIPVIALAVVAYIVTLLK